MSSEAGAAPKEGRLRNPICRLTLSLGARNWLVASSSRRFSLSTIFRDFTPANTKFLATLYSILLIIITLSIGMYRTSFRIVKLFSSV